MKKRTIIITLIILSLSAYFIFKLPKGTFKMIYKQYKLMNKETYNVKIGESFEINLNQNYSTGYKNCWLNQDQVKIIENIETEYRADNDDKNIIGGGGIETFTFKAIKRGIDTIKFSSCPALRERKKCNEYSSKLNDVDKMFIVNVTK